MQNGQEFEIKPAVRAGVPALVGLWGPSSTGKTLSALKIARGLVGAGGKIVGIDTENERMLVYANALDLQWHHLDLQPPFTPRRYIDAFEAAHRAGAHCVIVDSTSHVWEGEGGVLDMADNARTAGGRQLQGLAKWKGPKQDYKRFVNFYLRAPFHVIFCLRAKSHNVQTGKGQDAKIRYLGLAPICGEGFVHELTVAIMLGMDHKPVFQPTEDYHPTPLVPAIKYPGELEGAIVPGEYLSEATGERIRAWCDGGAAVDRAGPVTQELLDLAASAANLGTEQLRKWWSTLDRTQQMTLKPYMEGPEGFKAQATDADQAPPSDAPAADTPPAGDEDPLDDDWTRDGPPPDDGERELGPLDAG